MRKMILSTMSMLLVMSVPTYAEAISPSAQTGDQLLLAGEDKYERFNTAQATDSSEATLAAYAALSETEYDGEINGWQITVSPYAWLAAMDVTLTLDGRPVDVDLSFEDILDDF
jgi:hypothetical protein